MLVSWATYKTLKARMFWVKKLNLFHQAQLCRSQPCIRNEGPGVSFPQLLQGKRKQEAYSGVGALQAVTGAATALSILAAQAQNATGHWLGLLSSAWCPVLSGLILCAPRKAGDVASGNLELSPCYSTSPDTRHLIPLHLCSLMWHRQAKHVPYSSSSVLVGTESEEWGWECL